MRLIIDCDPDQVQTASAILFREVERLSHYDKIGWGWSYGMAPRFFVRRLKDGLSIKQTAARP